MARSKMAPAPNESETIGARLGARIRTRANKQSTQDRVADEDRGMQLIYRDRRARKSR